MLSSKCHKPITAFCGFINAQLAVLMAVVLFATFLGLKYQEDSSKVDALLGINPIDIKEQAIVEIAPPVNLDNKTTDTHLTVINDATINPEKKPASTAEDNVSADEDTYKEEVGIQSTENSLEYALSDDGRTRNNFLALSTSNRSKLESTQLPTSYSSPTTNTHLPSQVSSSDTRTTNNSTKTKSGSAAKKTAETSDHEEPETTNTVDSSDSLLDNNKYSEETTWPTPNCPGALPQGSTETDAENYKRSFGCWYANTCIAANDGNGNFTCTYLFRGKI